MTKTNYYVPREQTICDVCGCRRNKEDTVEIGWSLLKEGYFDSWIECKRCLSDKAFKEHFPGEVRSIK